MKQGLSTPLIKAQQNDWSKKIHVLQVKWLEKKLDFCISGLCFQTLANPALNG